MQVVYNAAICVYIQKSRISSNAGWGIFVNNCVLVNGILKMQKGEALKKINLQLE